MRELTLESLESDIERLTQRIESLTSQRTRIDRKLQEKKRQRDAALTVLDMYSQKVKKESKHIRKLKISPDELRGLGLEEAVHRIAVRNNGYLTSTAVRSILEEAGVLVGTKLQTSKEVYNFLSSSEKYEKLARGKYTLIDRED